MEWEAIRPLVPGLVMLAAVTAIFWFVVIRPTRKSQQRHQDLIKNLVPGDRVITVGGIYGKVVRVREDSFDMEVAKDIVMTFDRRAARKLRDE